MSLSTLLAPLPAEVPDWEQTLGTGALLGIAVGAIALILVLIIGLRIHAFVTLVLVSLLTAFVAGIPASAIVSEMTSGFGGTLASVALLVGLGAMLGRLIEHSGGAKVLADAMVRRFGEERAPFALGIASLIMGFPIFFDAGLIVMLPIIFAIARRLDEPVLRYGIPAAGAFSVMHVFLPPHPGPVAASEFFGANIGYILLIGLIIAFPLWYVSAYLWGLRVGRAHPLPVPALLGGQLDHDQPANPPSVGTIVGLLLIPLVLIFMNTGLSTLATSGHVDDSQTWVQVLKTLGETPVALLISVLVTLAVLGFARGEDKTALEKLLDSSLGPICSVVLITGAGGMFGGILRSAGIGDAMADSLSDLGLPLIVAVYLVSVLLRLAQGSATVALVTTAGLFAPAVAGGAGYNGVQLACITLAAAAGSVFCSHVNDSGFWLVGRLMGMDVKTTLRTWTVQQGIESVLGFAMVYVVYLVAGLV